MNRLVHYIIISFLVLGISIISKDNFINNDNYFSLSYLYMLKYDDFANSIYGFFPSFVPEYFINIITYLFITPLTSTYSVIPYIFYVIVPAISNYKFVLIYSFTVNYIINIALYIFAFNRFKKAGQIHLYYILLLITIFSIGNLVYIGSNMPYAFLNAGMLICIGLVIDKKYNYKWSFFVLLVLYLINYQFIFVLPTITLFILYNLHLNNQLDLKLVIKYSSPLFLVIISSLLFMYLRGLVTGTHAQVNVNWNAGLNNEFWFSDHRELNANLYNFIFYLPRSILYHLETTLYEKKFVGLVFYIFLFIKTIFLIHKKEYNILIIFYSFLGTFFILCLLGKSVFGPTRHTFYLLPLTIWFLLTNTNSKFMIMSAFVFSMLTVSNVKTIYDRNNNFFTILDESINDLDTLSNDSDILLFSCSYQPFLLESFRNHIEDKNVYFFCGSKLQYIQHNNIKSNKLIVIDTTGKSSYGIIDELNKRKSNDIYYLSDLKFHKNYLLLNHNIEQKDHTQLPDKTGIDLWIISNKFE